MALYEWFFSVNTREINKKGKLKLLSSAEINLCPSLWNFLKVFYFKFKYKFSLFYKKINYIFLLKAFIVRRAVDEWVIIRVTS